MSSDSTALRSHADEFRRLPDYEQTTLWAFAVLGSATSRSNLGQMLQRLGVKGPGNKQWVGRALGEALSRWKKAGLVWETVSGSRMLASAPLVDLCILDPNPSVIERVHRAVREEPFGSGLVEAGLRALCFSHSESDSWSTYDIPTHFYVHGNTWTQVILFGASKELWRRLPIELKESLFRDRLAQILGELHPAQDWELACFRAILGPEYVAESCNLVALCVYQNRLEAARAQLAAIRQHLTDDRRKAAFEGQAAHRAAEAMVCLFEGDVESARKHAFDALPFARGVTGRKAPSIRGPGGVWVALLLLTGTPEQVRLGHEFVSSEAAAKAAGLPNTFGVLQQMSAALSGALSTSIVPYPGTSLDDVLADLVALLTKRWGIASESSGLPRELREMLLARANDSHPLLAEELRQLALGKGKSHLEGALRSKIEPWQLLLAELESVIGEDAAVDSGETSGSERLIWRIDVREGRLHSLDAIVQKATKKGWSKGRRVGNAALVKLAHDGKWDESDRRLASNWNEHVERGWGYPRTYYEWSPKVFAALVGHERVYTRDDQHLRVIRAQPTVVVSQSKKGLRLQLTPVQAVDQGIWLEQVGDELLIYEISKQQARIAGLLTTASTIPASESERAKKLLAGLASTFHVTGDSLSFASDDVEEREVAGQLVLRLWRKQSGGVRFQLVVQPFGLEGPVLPPGEGPEVLVRAVEGGRAQVRRDQKTEREQLAELLEDAPLLQAVWDPAGLTRLDDVEACLELLSEVLASSVEVDVRWLEGQPLSIVARRDIGDMQWRLREAKEWFEATVDIELAPGEKVALQELLGLVRQGGRFVTLDDGQIVELTERLRDRVERLDRLGGVRKNKLKVHPLAAPSLDGIMEGAALKKGRNLLDERLETIEAAARLRPRVPAGLQAELRDYQLEGYRWLSRLGSWNAGALLCDDMGLGKTMQILAVLLARAKDGPSLVVAPTSVAAHWEDELCRFAPSLNVHRLSDADREALIDSLGPRDVVLATYGVLQREAELVGSREFEVVVLDEAQAIKNASTQRARAAFGLRGKRRIVSTGTPVENGLHELWSLMNFANPGLLGGQKTFTDRFARPIAEREDKLASDTLRKLVRPFILRRTKSQVLSELPEKTEIVLEVEPSDQERAIYEAIRSDAADRLTQAEAGKKKAGGGQARFQVLAALTKLRQAACHPALAGAKGESTSAKHEAFFALVDELQEGGHRALVFSQFVEHLSLLRKGLEQREVPYQYLDGQTPAKERRRRVASFQDGEGDLFLISLRAGGSGLNLTSADYVIHMDPWWNPAVEDQASDRVHRIGQTRPVTIYKLVSKGTVEQSIMALHGEKRETAERLLDGAESAKALDLEFLRSLVM